MKIAWVLGWAVPAPWFASIAEQRIPAATHLYFPPTAAMIEQLTAAAPFDHVVGYSLGSQLLLNASERVTPVGQIALLAPIFAFAREEGLGGRVARAQVRQLARWLTRDPSAALKDFYQRAGLDGSPDQGGEESTLPVVSDGFNVTDLQWGLDRLANIRVELSLPRGWRAWCGAADALLDAAQLHTLEPNISIVPSATHHPAALINAWANFFVRPNE
jgi:hypothetical protein